MCRCSLDFLIASSKVGFVRFLVCRVEGFDLEAWVSCSLWTVALACSLMVLREEAVRVRGKIVGCRVAVLDSLVLAVSGFLSAPVFVLEMLRGSTVWELSASWLVVWEGID